MKKYLNLYYFISIVFLCVFLAKNDILRWPRIESSFMLTVSVVSLFAGFMADALAWHIFLRQAGISATYRESLTSSGLSIFGKYIPGKLWIVLGKAGYIADRKQLPVEEVSMHSFKCQFISLWVASVFSGILFVFVKELRLYGVPMILFILFLSLLIFSDVFQKIVLKLVRRFLKREIAVPHVRFGQVSRVISLYTLNWLLWVTSFYFYLGALGVSMESVYIALAFPLAAVIGIISLFSPGGLGVREGIIALVLLSAGIENGLATTTAVSSRVWFLLGEIFIFLLSIALKANHAQKRAIHS